ncbi:phage tail assembly protein [Breoghania sp.]|uniref:phage tail assembly protein n=1 Tax=Breoghania sp. TaxID=2065378 RepID=UPI002AA62F12|nr:phage tail assembly protein [Breoghania sp.]
MSNIKSQASYTLEVPVEFEGREVVELTFRRIKGKDIKAMDRHNGTDVDKAFFMIARLSGMAPEFVDEMDGADFEACSKIIENFMGRPGRRA